MTTERSARDEEGVAEGPRLRHVDLLIDGAVVVTMNPRRDVLLDGAVAVHSGRIVDVGDAASVRGRVTADEIVAGRGFVVTPGLVNTHIHVTGEPITRGFVPDDTPFLENVFQWLCPLYAAQNEEDERTSAQLAAAELLLSGTTTLLEAGTIGFLDAVVDGLVETGIRGRVGRWIWDLPPEPSVYRQTTREAIRRLEDELDRYNSGALVRAWPMVVGHTTCSDELWRAASGLAREHATGLGGNGP
jgi:5-methylthioadenosine/S-adenosylhomocysteine deaminase